MAPELPLLEREDALASLDAALAAARAGQGRCVVVSGEAGIGKTRLLQAWQARHADVQWLGAACDPLVTPRPLGPLVDLADRFPPALGAALHEARTYNGLFPQLAGWLANTRPLPVLVLEDLHWADEATLDGVRYLGRRIAHLPALLLLTRRDDEPSPALARTLAQLDAAATVRVALPPLTDGALRSLAVARGRDAAALVRLAGGNPLFLQQLLASRPGELPGGVRDAVVARLAQLPALQRHVLEALAVAPGGLPLSGLTALVPGAAAALEAEALGPWLRLQPGVAAFRHELVRQAVEAATPVPRRAAFHAVLADRLADEPPRPGLLARRLHHAAGAGRATEVAALATPAAEEAERVGAPSAAADALRLALDMADAAGADVGQRVQWGLALARHQARAGAVAQAMSTLAQVRAQARRCGDVSAEVRATANLALMLSPRPDSVAEAEAARTLALPLGGVDSALAHYALALTLHNRGDPQVARPHAETAVSLAERAGDALTLSQALSVCGAVRLTLDADDAGFELLERGLALALEGRRHGAAAVAWVNLASLCLARADHRRLDGVMARGIPFCRDHDEDLALAMLLLRRALGRMETGPWSAVDDDLEALDGLPGAPARTRASAAVIRLRLQGLRGAPAADAAWGETAAQVEAGETEFLFADACGYAAEAAWLRADVGVAAALSPAAQMAVWARRGLDQAQGASPWLQGRLRRWLRLGGGDAGPSPADLPPPFVAEERGDPAAASAAWRAIGCPGEAAMAVLAVLASDRAGRAAPSRETLEAALQDAQALGAQALIGRLQRRLELPLPGRSVSTRGPYRAAATHRWGFTTREAQVARLLAEGLSNVQIAARLHRSVRTVDHHVSAILGKLAVQTRTQAVARLLAEAGGRPVGEAEGGAPKTG